MLPGHLSAHAASFAADDSIGLTASASVVIDERGRPVSQAVVEQGGLGPIDRIFEPGQLARSMAAGNPLRCSAVTLARRCASKKQGASTRGCATSSTGIAGCDYRGNGTVAWLARPTVQVRWHPASETHRFKTGLADLDETARMLETLFDARSQGSSRRRPPAPCRARSPGPSILEPGSRCPSRGASRAGSRGLCTGAFDYSPRLIKTIVGDPRLCVQMAALAVAPRLAARLFARRNRQ